MTPIARSPEPIIAEPVKLVRPMEIAAETGTLPRPTNDNPQRPATSLLQRRRERRSRLSAR